MAQARIQRHGVRARWLHGVNALALLILLATGFALAGSLPPRWVAWFGGHAAVNAAHRWLGLAFAIAAAALIGALQRATRGLLQHLAQARPRDPGWLAAWLRHTLAPRRYAPTPHDGYFDPLERVVLALLLLATVVTALSGVYLYFLPTAPLWVFVVTIRAHVYGAWVMLGALVIHGIAGSGILPTHRSIARSMFGDGTLPMATARGLWPGWTRRQAPVPKRPSA